MLLVTFTDPILAQKPQHYLLLEKQNRLKVKNRSIHMLGDVIVPLNMLASLMWLCMEHWEMVRRLTKCIVENRCTSVKPSSNLAIFPCTRGGSFA